MSRKSAAHDAQAWRTEVYELRQKVSGLQADNARLRELIYSVAPKLYIGPGGPVERDHTTPCPWCNRYPCETAPGGHAKDCPAFTPIGEVR